MIIYVRLDGFRWSCDSDSALCDIPQTNVLGQAEGGAYFWKNKPRSPILRDFGEGFYALGSFTGQQ